MALLLNIQYVYSYMQTYSEYSDGEKNVVYTLLDQFQNSLRKTLRDENSNKWSLIFMNTCTQGLFDLNYTTHFEFCNS